MVKLRAALEKLKAILEEDDVILSEMLILFAQEKDALKDFSLEAFDECKKRKETLALKAKMLDEARQGAIEKLAKAAGVESKKLTISLIEEMAGESYGGALAKLAASLRDKVEKAKLLNMENERLMKFSTESIKSTIYLLTQVTSPAPVYDSGGKVRYRAGDHGLIFARRS